jgi:iron complex transport system substrate-binding protein
MQPDLIVGFGLNKSNPSLDILQKWFKSDVQWRWTEQSPLGKA